MGAMPFSCKPLIDQAQAQQHLLGGFERILLRTLQRLRRAEESHDAIADEFVHRAPVLVDGNGHLGKIIVEQGDHFLRRNDSRCVR